MTVNQQLLKQLASYVLLATVVLGIVAVLPFTEAFLFQSKFYVFVFGTLLLGFLYAVYSIKKGALEIVLSPFLGPVVFFGAAVLASTFFTNSYPVESLLGLGGTYLAMVLFVLFGSSVAHKSLPEKIMPALAIGGSLLTLLTAAQLAGFGPAQMINNLMGLQLPTNLSFNVAGSALVGLQIIALTIIGLVIEVVSKKHFSKLTAVTLPILLIGLAIHIWAILPGKPGQVLTPNWGASWSIALDTIRTPRAALIGVGPEAYGNMYTRFKPAWINATPTWSVTFNQGSNFLFTLLTTTGFIGLISWLIIGWVSFKAMKRAHTAESKTFAMMLVATLILQLLMPTNILILMLQGLLVLGYIVAERSNFSVVKFQALAMTIEKKFSDSLTPVSKASLLPVYLTSGAFILLLGIATYMAGRAYAAGVYSFQASKALAANDAVKVYEYQQKSVQLNPYYDVYRRQYALTNMLIAAALAEKADASDAEKEQIAQLLQQAVREARSATLLDELDVQNWSVLAQIYQNMIGGAEEADDWAVQAYVAAIENDPTNPSLRFNVGSIFLGQEQYQQAFSLFNQAIQLKPDYANAYYNAAFALKQLNALPEAKSALEQLLKLMDPASEDYVKVSQELEELTAQVEEMAEATKSAQLQQNNTILDQNIQQPTQVVNEPVQDDVELNPETTPLGEEVTETAAPEATPEPTPAP